MKKIMLIVLCVVVAGLFSACGGSEQGCVEQCALSYSKGSSLCGAQHGRLSREGNECTKLALKENDQCAAKCYGM
jgi:hypothetical protein